MDLAPEGSWNRPKPQALICLLVGYRVARLFGTTEREVSGNLVNFRSQITCILRRCLLLSAGIPQAAC